MLRFVAALLCLILVEPVTAQKAPSPANNAATVLAETTTRAEKAERDLAIREAADQLEEAQTEQAYNRFEIVIGLFSVLMTVLVIVFGFRTERAAGVAARQEVASAKGQIDELLSEARNATAAALSAQTQAEIIKAEVDQLRQQSSDAAAQAKANAAETSRQVQSVRKAAAVMDSLKPDIDVGRDKPTLTPAQAKIVQDAAKGTEGKPESNWSIEEFKTRIGKAKFIDRDWPEVLRLAQQMINLYGVNKHVFAFASNAEGDSLRELARHGEAVEPYARVIARLGKFPSADLEQSLIWAMHNMGVSLIASGRPEEAEKVLRDLITLCERVDGEEHPYTLITRHQLGRSIFYQGRSNEAALLYRELLPLRERIEGIGHSGTLVTRYWSAAATLAKGDALAAQALLDPIPDQPPNFDWTLRWSAKLAFIRGKVADALGNRADADEWLRQAEEHYAAVYPPDHYYRRQFEAYFAGRPGA